jgi:hypothetical protein
MGEVQTRGQEKAGCPSQNSPFTELGFPQGMLAFLPAILTPYFQGTGALLLYSSIHKGGGVLILYSGTSTPVL